MGNDGRDGFFAAILAGLIVVVLVLAAIVYRTHVDTRMTMSRPPPPPAGQHL